VGSLTLPASGLISTRRLLSSGCALLLTNDTGLKRVPGLNITLLDEVVSAP
jgi:hypothetical protein